MKSSLSTKEKAVKDDFGKVKKVVKIIKKIMAKELLWLLFVLIISIPISLILAYVVSSEAQILNQQLSKDIEDVSEIITFRRPAFTLIFSICVVGMYFSRTVVNAIKTLVNDKK
ncbi:hypothetical protein [Tenacibaculum agarivorans]|uniref:hypothetical protein n=1 Tax=Tenacibaculum agarivorans TaxID=1908389 RepID=UPI00094B9516|nr:hypothetical protein [Tenacibaculum agarivorans]